MQEIPVSTTPEEGLANADVILIWENYFREDDAIPEWLQMARAEFEQIERYYKFVDPESTIVVNAELLSRLMLMAGALWLRIVVVEAEFSSDAWEVDEWGRPVIDGRVRPAWKKLPSQSVPTD